MKVKLTNVTIPGNRPEMPPITIGTVEFEVAEAGSLDAMVAETDDFAPLYGKRVHSPSLNETGRVVDLDGVGVATVLLAKGHSVLAPACRLEPLPEGPEETYRAAVKNQTRLLALAQNEEGQRAYVMHFGQPKSVTTGGGGAVYAVPLGAERGEWVPLSDVRAMEKEELEQFLCLGLRPR